MLLQVIGENAERSGSAADLGRVWHHLTLRRVRRNDAVGSIQSPARAGQGQVQLAERGLEFISDFYKRHLVDLVDDLFDLPFRGLQISPYGRQLNRLLRPVHGRRLRTGKEIECNQRGARKQISGAKLRANAVSHQAVDHPAPRTFEFRGWSLTDNPDAETLRIEVVVAGTVTEPSSCRPLHGRLLPAVRTCIQPAHAEAGPEIRWETVDRSVVAWRGSYACGGSREGENRIESAGGEARVCQVQNATPPGRIERRIKCTLIHLQLIASLHLL